MARQAIDPERADEIAAMYQAGVPITAICAEMTTSAVTIYRVLYAKGIELRGRGNQDPKSTKLFAGEEALRLREAELQLREAKARSAAQAKSVAREAITQLYKAGMPTDEIAASLLVRPGTVRKMLVEAGFTLRRGRPSQSRSPLTWFSLRRTIREAKAQGTLLSEISLESLSITTGQSMDAARLALQAEVLRDQLEEAAAARSTADDSVELDQATTQSTFQAEGLRNQLELAVEPIQLYLPLE